MPVTAETWLLQPSRRQRWLDAAFMAVTLGLLWPLLSPVELAVAGTGVGIFVVVAAAPSLAAGLSAS